MFPEGSLKNTAKLDDGGRRVAQIRTSLACETSVWMVSPKAFFNSDITRQVWVLAILFWGVCAGSLTMAQDGSVVTPAAANSPETTIKLNQAIRAVFEGKLEEAKKLFKEIEEVDRGNPSCLYHLGLIYLEQGVELSSDQPTKVAAQANFKEAREYFRKLLEPQAGRAAVDASLVPTEAALNLGVAQLASDIKEPGREDEARKNSQDAVKILSKYVANAEGKGDRYGWLYLGIAYYRLGVPIEDAKELLDQGSLSKAHYAFETASTLAKGDLDRKVITDADFAVFTATISYYSGLIGMIRNDAPDAIRNFRLVEEAYSDPTRYSAGAGSQPKLRNYAETFRKDLELQEKTETGRQGIVIDSPVGPLTLQGSAKLGNQYDSNIILLGYHTPLPQGYSKQQDYRFQLEGGMDVTRQFQEKELPLGKSLVIGVGGTTFNLWQPSIGQYQVNTYNGRAYVNYEPVRDLFTGIQYDYSYTKLGSEPFISSNRITPVVSMIWPRKVGDPERARTDFYYSYDYRNYKDEIPDFRFDRDGSYHAVGVNQTFNLIQAKDIWQGYYAGIDEKSKEDADRYRWMSFHLGYLYRNERTQGDEYDLSGNTVLASIEVPLPKRFSFDFLSEFTWDNYSQPSVLDFRRNERFDFIQHYGFGLSYILVGRGELSSMPTLDVKIRGGVDVYFQDSNIWDRLHGEPYTFDRTIYGLQLAATF